MSATAFRHDPGRPLTANDLNALTAILDQHLRVREDQIQALLCSDPGATAPMARHRALALAHAAAAEVDAAMVRITDGSYGRCFRCSRPITPERLYSRPQARLCLACAAEQ